MKIAVNGMFHTPASMDEVGAWIDRHAKEERIHLWTAAVMTWNFLATQVNSEAELPTPGMEFDRGEYHRKLQDLIKSGKYQSVSEIILAVWEKEIGNATPAPSDS